MWDEVPRRAKGLPTQDTWKAGAPARRRRPKPARTGNVDLDGLAGRAVPNPHQRARSGPAWDDGLSAVRAEGGTTMLDHHGPHAALMQRVRRVTPWNHRGFPNGNVLLAHHARNHFVGDGLNESVHILQRPLHIPDEPPRLLGNEGGRRGGKLKDGLLPLSGEVPRRPGLGTERRESDARIVHGAAQDLSPALPTLLSGDPIRRRAEYGAKVGSS
jgi:hypothetical protein